MPLFEYRCRQCGVQFEALVRSGDQPACPSCRTLDLEQLPSLFAVDSAGTRDAARRSSLPRSQQVHRDKEVGEQEDYDRHRH
ncbi:MAG TPA: zinc ribbon domain-containing protein [Vicinamibacterales bacterium]|nr:zinc ribbon domain-containing protein [Vicinamibacterales bacterium]